MDLCRTQGMNNGRRKGRLNKPVSSRCCPPEAMPLILCGACLMEGSKKAKVIYNKIAQGYSLPGTIEWNAPAYSSDLFLPGYAGAPVSGGSGKQVVQSLGLGKWRSKVLAKSLGTCTW